MRTMLLVVGVVILLAGVGTFAYGALSPTTTSSSSQQRLGVASPAVAQQQVSAKADWETGASLSQGTVVGGTFSVAKYNSSAGPYFFYIENKVQYVAWAACAPCKSANLLNGSANSAGSYTFTYTVPTDDSYFFVFDGDVYKAPAVVSLSTNATTTVTVITNTSSPNNSIIYPGSGIALLGLVVAAVSITRPSATSDDAEKA